MAWECLAYDWLPSITFSTFTRHIHLYIKQNWEGDIYIGLCIQPCTCKNNATMSFHFHYVAFGALAITLLHVCWGVMWFDGWERRRWWWVVLVPVSHMVISCLVCTYTYTQ